MLKINLLKHWNIRLTHLSFDKIYDFIVLKIKSEFSVKKEKKEEKGIVIQKFQIRICLIKNRIFNLFFDRLLIICLAIRKRFYNGCFANDISPLCSL